MLIPERSGWTGEPRRSDGGTRAGAIPALSGPGAMLVRCDAGGGSYCLDAGRVAAIERAERLVADPGEDGRLGWIGGPRDPVPVYALASLLGLEAPGAPSGPIVVAAGAGGTRRGLAVERVARVTAASAPLALPEPVRSAAGGRFAGAVRLGDRLALVLDPERLVSGNGTDRDPRGEASGNGAPETAADARVEPEPAGGEVRSGARSQSPISPAAAAGGPEPPPRAVMLFSPPRNGRHGGLLFGLSLAQVEEVLRPVPVTPVPAAGAGLLGVLLWRDRVVPVIDLSGGPAADPASGRPGRLLVVRGVRRPGRVAFPVRADLRVEPLPLPSRAWADGPRISPLAALGVFELAAGTVVVPDVDRILTPDRAGPDPGRAARSAPDERGESDEKS